ncbi:MAG: SCO family protein [Nannocystaceae bacterium]
MRRRIWFVAVVFGVLMITIPRWWLRRLPPPPAVLFDVPEFVLTDQTGHRFGSEQMRGQVWVVGFVFTRCPSVCPRVSQVMRQVQDDIEKGGLADKVKMLTITVDPQYDTPEVLSDYARTLGADAENWRFVTGDKDAIESLVVGGFKLALGERQETTPGVFDIAHATRLALVDQRGGVRALHHTDDGNRAEFFNHILAVLRSASE